jgi:hypothetical protein
MVVASDNTIQRAKGDKGAACSKEENDGGGSGPTVRLDEGETVTSTTRRGKCRVESGRVGSGASRDAESECSATVSGE